MSSQTCKLVVLGGSSPFTAQFVDSLVAQAASESPPMRIVLQGRNEQFLDLLTRYANEQFKSLRWSASWTTDYQQALEGADIVLHQNRYGGLELRNACEKICEEFQVVADETLGVGALLTAISIHDEVTEIATLISNHCDNPWLVNLTNPLSVVTKQFCDSACGDRVLGICESHEFR